MFLWLASAAVIILPLARFGFKESANMIYAVVSRNPSWKEAVVLGATSMIYCIGAGPMWPTHAILTGCVFGFYIGFLINFISLLAASIISFAIGRTLLFEHVRPLFMQNDWKAMQHMLRIIEHSEKSLIFLLLFRFIPLPMVLLNYVPSILDIPASHFLASVSIHTACIMLCYSWIGSLMQNAVEVLQRGDEISLDSSFGTVIAAVSVVNCIVMLWYARHEYRKAFKDGEMIPSFGVEENGVQNKLVSG